MKPPSEIAKPRDLCETSARFAKENAKLNKCLWHNKIRTNAYRRWGSVDEVKSLVLPKVGPCDFRASLVPSGTVVLLWSITRGRNGEARYHKAKEV